MATMFFGFKMAASNRYGSNQLKFRILALQLFKRPRYGDLKNQGWPQWLQDGHHGSKMAASNRYESNQLKFRISTLQLFKRLRYGHLKKSKMAAMFFGFKMVASNRYGSNQLKFRISTLQLFKRLRYGQFQKIQDGRQTKPNLKILKRQFEAEYPYVSIDNLKSKIRPLLAIL